MPTYALENLKKQAKLILRWHRERHYPVAAQIRGRMPRFLNMPGSEIIAANFKLSDAQEMLARQQGFESWTFRHAAQGEIVAIQSDDCLCRAATVRHRYQKIMRILP
ncbi:MAG: hypothetical protein WBQ89_16090 [Candidatus Acidiferrum sp.]